MKIKTNKMNNLEICNQLAEELYGEFGFTTCDEEQMLEILNMLVEIKINQK
jgi:hypothetical protein